MTKPTRTTAGAATKGTGKKPAPPPKKTHVTGCPGSPCTCADLLLGRGVRLALGGLLAWLTTPKPAAPSSTPQKAPGSALVGNSSPSDVAPVGAGRDFGDALAAGMAGEPLALAEASRIRTANEARRAEFRRAIALEAERRTGTGHSLSASTLARDALGLRWHLTLWRGNEFHTVDARVPAGADPYGAEALESISAALAPPAPPVPPQGPPKGQGEDSGRIVTILLPAKPGPVCAHVETLKGIVFEVCRDCGAMKTEDLPWSSGAGS